MDCMQNNDHEYELYTFMHAMPCKGIGPRRKQQQQKSRIALQSHSVLNTTFSSQTQTQT